MPDELDIPRRLDLASYLRQPAFWEGCAAVHAAEPTVIAAYARAAAALRADPTRDPHTVPEIAAWCARRWRYAGER